MTDIMAAIGLRQLDRYLALLVRRKEIIVKYDKTCDALGIKHMQHHVEGMDSSNHLYLIRVPGIKAEERNKIIEKMADKGVATNVHYKPLPVSYTHLDVYKRQDGYSGQGGRAILSGRQPLPFD